MARQPKIEIVSRKVRPSYGRAHTVYDAEGFADDIPYCVLNATTRTEARDRARADIAFLREQPTVTVCGFELSPIGHRVFSLKFPHGGSCGFSAASIGLALADLALIYHDHPEIPKFIRRAIDELNAEESTAVARR